MSYKNKQSGIYKIINKQNGMYYLGSSSDIKHRWIAHKSLLRRGIHSNSYLQNAWTKYGEENFVFEIMEEIGKDRDKVLLLDQIMEIIGENLDLLHGR